MREEVSKNIYYLKATKHVFGRIFRLVTIWIDKFIPHTLLLLLILVLKKRLLLKKKKRL